MGVCAVRRSLEDVAQSHVMRCSELSSEALCGASGCCFWVLLLGAASGCFCAVQAASDPSVLFFAEDALGPSHQASWDLKCPCFSRKGGGEGGGCTFCLQELCLCLCFLAGSAPATSSPIVKHLHQYHSSSWHHRSLSALY